MLRWAITSAALALLCRAQLHVEQIMLLHSLAAHLRRQSTMFHAGQSCYGTALKSTDHCRPMERCRQLGDGQGCAPFRPNMLLRLHHGVPMECASAAWSKLALCRKKSNQQTALTERRGRSLRIAWSKPMLAIPTQICKRGAPSRAVFIRGKRTV